MHRGSFYQEVTCHLVLLVSFLLVLFTFGEHVNFYNLYPVLFIVKMSQTGPSCTESYGHVRHLEDLKALDELCVARPILLTIAQSFLPRSKKLSPIFEEVRPSMYFQTVPDLMPFSRLLPRSRNRGQMLYAHKSTPTRNSTLGTDSIGGSGASRPSSCVATPKTSSHTADRIGNTSEFYVLS